MVHRLAAYSACLVLPALVGGGCSCSEQNIVARGYPPLDHDHGAWLSMDVAPDGRIVVSFYDKTMGGVGFAAGDIRNDTEVGWRYEEVDGYPDELGLNPGDRGKFTSLEVADDGTVWVSYHNNAQGGLLVAHRGAGYIWEIETADVGSGPQPNAGEWTSLALAADGTPVVAHYEESRHELRVARRTGGAWQAETVFEGEDWVGTDDTGAEITRTADAGMYATLAIVGNTEYIVFYDAANQSLNLLEGFAGQYTHTVVDDSGNVGQWPSIWTDGTDIAIAYHDRGNFDLKLARRTGGNWDIDVIDDSEYIGSDTAIFKDGDNLGIVYFDGRVNNMNIAVQDGEIWNYQTLGGEDAAIGFHNEVVQDLQGRWWAASYDYTNRNLFIRRILAE